MNTKTSALRATKGGCLILIGLVTYLTEFVGMAIAGGFPSNEPGTPIAQVPDVYVGIADGAGFLAGWMALVLTGRILIIIGIREAVGRSGLLDWAVAAMVVSVVLEVASIAGIAAAAGLVADGAGLDAVIAADRIAWHLGASIAAPAGLAVALSGVGLWRDGGFPPAIPVVGLVLGLVLIANGLLAGAPATYPIAGVLSLGVVMWWLWVVWVGILLVRRARVRPRAAVAADPVAG